MDSATASAAGGKFEVFLSFCGKDTRYGFADYLYNDLEEARIRTFRDNEKLHVGEEIGAELLKAIKDSKISIPIFSKNYASSKWCLGELAQMVECQESGHKIFPIFYDVQPSDVRHQTGSYEKAFRIHKERKRSDKKSEETVEKWKKALREVGQLKGWELQKETNGHQGKLVKIVVRRVLLELKKNYMDVTDDIVGIDHHLEVVMGLLNVNSNGVWIVGIHGMGGIGKTTIAKVIYNQLSEHFECCVFLADVRETSKSLEGLVNQQNQFISTIRKEKSDIFNVDEGIKIIKEIVYRKKVLVVLDDVDKRYQFDKLAGKCDWFGSGSRIIVTTRNKDILNVLDVVDKAYEVQFMEPKHSLQLFSRHAFRKDFPPEDYDDLSRKITSTAAGLPLALEILGSSLYGRPKDIWKGTLSRLKNIPNEEVEEKLRISYDALDHEQRQIFLDIACHFIGRNSIDPFYMWDDCKFYPTNGFYELILRSLVQVGDHNELRMHDQLRDVGRNIVRKESFNRPEERSRSWLHDDAFDILERRAGTKMIETLCIDIGQREFQEIHSLRHLPNFHFTDEEFRPLPNLRFLRLNKVELTGDFKHLFSNLRWLKWCIFPGNFSPTNFHLKNLVVLDLSDSKIKDDWEGWSQIKEAKKLKALYLERCSDLTRTPDLSTFATLERLDLTWCRSLVQIDPSIADLINLRVLHIQDSGITKLPDAIGNLKKLEEIDASCCRNLQGEIPSSIGGLSSLQALSLSGCSELQSLPTSICGLSSLQTLDLAGCTELQSLPTSICGLSSLQTLDLAGCTELQSLPTSICGLSSLQTLDLTECEKLQSLPTSICGLSSLQTLDLAGCTELQSLPTSICGLSSLQTLDLTGCEKLQSLPTSICGLSSLQTVDLTGCEKLQSLPTSICGLSSLQTLDLTGCEKLQSLPTSICGLSSLQTLDLAGCEKLQSLPTSICGLSSLQTLDLAGCTELQSLPTSICGLSSLQTLDLTGCEKLQSLPTSICGLSSLQTLDLAGCTELQSLPTSICGLSSLQTLDLEGCTELQSLPELPPTSTSLHVTCKFLIFPSLSKLMNLKELSFSKCLNLVEIPGDIGKLSKLEALTFYNTNITSLPAEIGALSCLKKLNVKYCSKLMEIQGLEKLEQLTSLDVSGCESLERLPDLSNLMQLKRLTAASCKKLIEIQGLDRLESLQDLNMTGCICIERLADLSNLRMLKLLNLSKCEKLAEVRGLWGLKSLETLDLSRCPSLERLPELSNLGLLKTLYASRCEKLVEVDGLGDLKSLEKLYMSWCTLLERLPDLSNLKKLGVLNISHCGKLTEIRGLEELKSLRLLDIAGCHWIIGKLPDLPKMEIIRHSKEEEEGEGRSSPSSMSSAGEIF